MLALVVSRLHYCNALLAGASQHQLEKLQRLQNRVARLVARPHTLPGGVVHITPISCSDCTGFLYTSEFSTKFVYLFTTACMVWVLPTCQNCYSTTSGTGRLRRPSATQLRQHQPRRRVGRVSFGVAGPQVWNSLPVSLRETGSLSDFKALLKNLPVASGVLTSVLKSIVLLHRNIL